MQLLKPEYPLEKTSVLICPKCGDECTHMQSATLFFRDIEDSITGLKITAGNKTVAIANNADQDNPSSRRDGMRMLFRCESGHLFNLDIYQHKGPTYFEAQFIGDDPEHPGNGAHL